MRSPRRAAEAGAGPATGRPAPGELLVAALVGAVVVLTALAGPLVVHPHDPPAWLQVDVTFEPQAPPAVPPGDEPVDEAIRQGPAWLGDAVRWTAIAAVAVLAAYGLWYLARVLRTMWGSVDRGGDLDVPAGGPAVDDEVDEATRHALEAGVGRATDALRADLPPGDAVVAAWLALERAAGGCGVERDPAATASEFTVALLDRTRADRRAARTLLRLYHAARFSDHEVTADDVATARAALAALAAGLVPRGEVTT